MAICWRHCTSRCLTNHSSAHLRTPSTADGPKDGPVHVEEIVGFLVSTWHVTRVDTKRISEINTKLQWLSRQEDDMSGFSWRRIILEICTLKTFWQIKCMRLLVCSTVLCMFVFVTYSFNYAYACSFHSTLHCGPVAMAFGEKRPLLVPSTVTWYRSGKGRLQGTAWNQQRLWWSLIHGVFAWMDGKNMEPQW